MKIDRSILELPISGSRANALIVSIRWPNDHSTSSRTSARLRNGNPGSSR